MNTPKRKALSHLSYMTHSDDAREKINSIIAHLAPMTRAWNGEPEPKVDLVGQWATANNVAHLPRNVQEIAFKTANPHVDLEAESEQADDVAEWAMKNNMGGMAREVQEAAFAAVNPEQAAKNAAATAAARDKTEDA